LFKEKRKLVNKPPICLKYHKMQANVTIVP
jgi:hypothetical protein